MSKASQKDWMLIKLSRVSSGVSPVVFKLSTKLQSWIWGVSSLTHSNKTKFTRYMDVTLSGSPSGKPVVDRSPGPDRPVITNRCSNPVMAWYQGRRICSGNRILLAMAKTGAGQAVVALHNVAYTACQCASIIPGPFNHGCNWVPDMCCLFTGPVTNQPCRGKLGQPFENLFGSDTGPSSVNQGQHTNWA